MWILVAAGGFVEYGYSRTQFSRVRNWEPLVQEANTWPDELGLTNLHYLFCNVNNSRAIAPWLLPSGTLQRVTIQFPDPGSKIGTLNGGWYNRS